MRCAGASQTEMLLQLDLLLLQLDLQLDQLLKMDLLQLVPMLSMTCPLLACETSRLRSSRSMLSESCIRLAE